MKFQNLQEQMETRFDQQLEFLGRIENQTLKTNGLVAGLTKWREQMKGGMKVSGVVLLFVILPLAAYVLYNQAMEGERIQSAVRASIDDYIQNATINK